MIVQLFTVVILYLLYSYHGLSFALTAFDCWNVFIHPAELAEIYTGALKNSLFLKHQERLCMEIKEKASKTE